MRYIEQANSQRQKAKWWSPVGEGSGRWRVIATSIKFQFGKMRKVLDINGFNGYTTM